jgi:four helix bundle protein
MDGVASSRMRNPDNLRVAQAAEDFAVLLYEYTRDFPRDERWGLTAHARKTAISIGSSVFEACGRLTNKGFVAALGVAHGEANEMLFQIRVAQRLGYGNSNLGLQVRKKLAHLQRMIYKLIIETRGQRDLSVDSSERSERSPGREAPALQRAARRAPS